MESVMLNGIEVFVEAPEKHIQINDIRREDIAGLWACLKAAYPGYNVDFCFRDVEVPVEVLTEIGAELLEDCVKMRLLPQDHKAYESHQVGPLTENDFDDFAAFHDAIDHGMYWTSRRMRDKMDIWRIVALKTNGNISGYSMLRVKFRDASLGEIYCVEADNPSKRKSLLSAAVRCAFEEGKSEVIFMVDNDATEQEEALAIGFSAVGFYTAYNAVLPEE